MSPDDPPGQRTPDPYADTGPFRCPGPPSQPPPGPGRRRRVLRDVLPTWLGVLAAAFILGLVIAAALVTSPVARHDAARVVRLVHRAPVTKTAGNALSERQDDKLLTPAVVVRPASAAPVVTVLGPSLPPAGKPSPKPSPPKPVTATPTPKPKPAPTAPVTTTPVTTPASSPPPSPTTRPTTRPTPTHSPTRRPRPSPPPTRVSVNPTPPHGGPTTPPPSPTPAASTS
jgi:outer membrane biosynthesis protein TonB